MLRLATSVCDLGITTPPPREIDFIEVKKLQQAAKPYLPAHRVGVKQFKNRKKFGLYYKVVYICTIQ
jgi:hypothetical protein